MPKGVPALKFFLVVGGVLIFFLSYGYAVWEVVGEGLKENGKEPDLNDGVLYVGAALGAVLGTLFATAMGVQRKDPTTDGVEVTKLGATLVEQEGAPAWITMLAMWVYALVGLAVGAAVILWPAEAPQQLDALASVFGGYALGVFGAVLAPTSTSGG